MQRLLIVMPLALVLACGGTSTQDSAGAGGSAGSGTGGSAGSGTGGSAGSGIGGSGGFAGAGTGGSATGGSAGVAGAGGSATCSQIPPSAPAVGFEALPGSISFAVVTAVTPTGLELSLGPGASPLKFRWVGPSLLGKLSVGEDVDFGDSNGWHYVVGKSYVAVAYRALSFVGPESPPPIPHAGPALFYAEQCTFPDAQGACGEPPADVRVLALDTTTGAGVVRIDAGQTGEIVGWQIHNAESVQYPSYGSQNCDAEAQFTSTITALGPSTKGGG